LRQFFGCGGCYFIVMVCLRYLLLTVSLVATKVRVEYGIVLDDFIILAKPYFQYFYVVHKVKVN